MATDGEKASSKKWAQKNRKRRTYLSCRGTCYTFIRRYGDLDDLITLRKFLAERITELEKGVKIADEPS